MFHLNNKPPKTKQEIQPADCNLSKVFNYTELWRREEGWDKVLCKAGLFLCLGGLLSGVPLWPFALASQWRDLLSTSSLIYQSQDSSLPPTLPLQNFWTVSDTESLGICEFSFKVCNEKLMFDEVSYVLLCWFGWKRGRVTGWWSLTSSVSVSRILLLQVGLSSSMLWVWQCSTW